MSRLRWFGTAWFSLVFLLVIRVNGIAPAAPGYAPTQVVISVTATPSMTATLTPSPTAMATATATPSPTLRPSATPTQTPSPTATWTPEPTATHTPSPTPAPTEACRPAESNVSAVSVPVGPWPRPQPFPSAIGRGPTGANFISLTFDVEGAGELVGQLLNVLDKHNVKATFFIVGSWAEANGRWLTEIAQRGHEFGNHTYSHPNLRDLTAEEVQQELTRTETIVQQLTGQSTKPWMRPPYGAYHEATVQTVYEAGWSTVIWTGTGIDTAPDASESSICNNLMRSAIPGAILLVHPSKAVTIPAIDRFMTEMIARGYTFVPLAVLFNG